MPTHFNIRKLLLFLTVVGFAMQLHACGYRVDSLQSLQQTTNLTCDPNVAPADGTTAIDVHINSGSSFLIKSNEISVHLQVDSNDVVIKQPDPLDELGQATGSMTTRTPGVYTVSVYATFNETTYLLTDPFVVTFTKLPRELQLSATPESVSADAQATVYVHGRLIDSTQQPIQNAEITFESHTAGDVMTPSTIITDAQGEVTTSLLSTRAGVRLISAQAPDANATTSFEITAGEANSTYCHLTVNPNIIYYGSDRGSTAITVLAQDQYQNPIPNLDVNLSSSEATDTLQPAVQMTDANGYAHFVLSADSSAGNSNHHLLQASMQNVTLNANLTVLPATYPQNCSFEVNPNVQFADNANLITAKVTVRDNLNHALPNATVHFSASGTTTQLSNVTAVTDSNGYASCSYYSSVAQNENVVAEVQGAVFTAPISFVHGTEYASLSYLTLDPVTQPANGTDAIAISAHLKDRFGNPVNNKTLNFSLYGSGGPFSANSATTDSLGVANTQLVSSVAGSNQVYAATANATISIKATFTSNAGYCNAEPNYVVKVINVGKAPQNIISSDVNHDGCMDLIITENTNNTVAILGGSCNGNFTVTHRYAVGQNPWGVVAIDLDQDGHTDLAVATAKDGNIAVLLGNGDGSFGTPVIYNAIAPPLGARTESFTNIPFEIASGDFNEDGYPDLVAASGPDNKMVVFLGTGLGTLYPGISYPTGTKPWGIAVADFNKDGHADIALPINNGGTFGNYVSLWTGIGNGNFKSRSVYCSQSCIQGIGVGDFNGDSYPDLAVPNDCESALSIFWGGDSNANLGGGSLAAAPSYLLNGTVTNVYNTLNVYGGLKIYDFDQDGILDVVVTDTHPGSNPNQSHTGLFLGSPNGTLTLANQAGTSNYGLAIELGDIYEDGVKDVIVSTTNLGQTSFTLDLLSMNTSTKQLAFSKSISIPNIAWDIKAEDLDQDGHVDLIVTSDANQGSVGVLMGQGGGNFNDIVYYATNTSPKQMLLGNWNQDGHDDLAVSNQNDISILWGQGDGTFVYGMTLSPGFSPRGLTSADFNGDGIDDLAVTAYGGTSLAVFFGKEGGVFENPRLYSGAYPFGIALATGDLDGDGYPDLIATHATATLSTTRQFSISVFFGTSSGIFKDPVYYQGGRGNPSIQIADLNQDGKLDVVTGASDNMLVTLFNQGDGILQDSLSYLANSAAWSIHVNDFNGDAIPDLIIPNGIASNVTNLFVGKGDGTFKDPYNLVYGQSAIGAVSGYFNNDTHMDFAVTDLKQNKVYVYLYTSCVN